MAAHPGHLPPPSVIAEQERMAYLLDLREVPHEVIAERLGISVRTVANRIKAGREARVRDDAEQLRDHIDDQYREDYRTVSLMMAATDDPDLKLKCVAQRVNISRERRKLNAVDRPTPLEAALTARVELEAEHIATTTKAVTDAVLGALTDVIDPGFRQRLEIFAFESAAYEMERADGGDPGPPPEVPKPQLAITAGTATTPADGPGDDDGPSVPHPRRRDPVDVIMDRARALLEETEDDEDEEEDQN